MSRENQLSTVDDSCLAGKKSGELAAGIGIVVREWDIAAPKKLYAKILVVEDNEMIRLVVDGILKEYDVKIEFVANGKKAVYRIKVEAFYLIFMDCEMPTMVGSSATKNQKIGKRRTCESSYNCLKGQ